MFKGAWSAFRSRPLVWLFVSAACVPYVLGMSLGALPVVAIPGFLVTYMLLFLSWCMASYAYGAGDAFGTRAMLAEGREVLAYQWARSLNLSIMFAAIAYVVMNILLPVVLITAYSMLNPSDGVITGIFFQFASYVLLALPMALFALTPQLAILNHDFDAETDAPTGALRTSYLLIKDRYKDALLLYLLPELAASALVLLLSLLIFFGRGFFSDFGFLYIPILLLMALIQGAKTAFVAAAFNLFLDRVEAEERAKRKKKKAAPAGSAREERRPPAKKEAPRKSGPSPHKKKR